MGTFCEAKVKVFLFFFMSGSASAIMGSEWLPGWPETLLFANLFQVFESFWLLEIVWISLLFVAFGLGISVWLD